MKIKITYLFLLSILSVNVSAKCPKEFPSTLELEFKRIDDSSSQMHGNSIQLKLSAPSKIGEFDLNGIDVTLGETSEVFIPLKITKNLNSHTAILSGYPSSLEKLGLIVTYTKNECVLWKLVPVKL